MASYDLTTLADVKAWLGRSDSNSDALIGALITRTSRQIHSYLQRTSLLPHAVTEVRDGPGGNLLLLKQWPAIGVTSLTVEGSTIPAALLPGDPGWRCETWDGAPPGRPQAVSLTGYVFGCSFPGARNSQNVVVAYQAGYQVTDEAQPVAGGTATVAAPFGAWASDVSVVYANGTPLQRVSGTPGAGQYQLATAAGAYNFNAADEGANILITYGYVPADLADACIELVAERYKYTERIGERSHSLGGNETVSFDNSRLTPLVQNLLQPYRMLIPI